VAQALEEIQKALYERALAFRQANTAEPADYAEFQGAVERGFASSWWCGSAACEEKIKAETKATVRCIPIEQPPAGGAKKCIYCGEPAAAKAIFGRAYSHGASGVYLSRTETRRRRVCRRDGMLG